LRRLDLPLDEAARIAGWCHAGHCAESTEALPALIARRRAAIRDRIAGLQALDARLASLERHVGPADRRLSVVADGPCGEAAAAVESGAEGRCGRSAAPALSYARLPASGRGCISAPRLSPRLVDGARARAGRRRSNRHRPRAG